jgi:hypothetical protein
MERKSMGKKALAGIALACAACLPVAGAVAAIVGIAAVALAVLGAIPSASTGFLDKIKLLAKAIYGKMLIGARRVFFGAILAILSRLKGKTINDNIILDGYQICLAPIQPKWDETIYDNDYPYDPNLIATQEDNDNWKQWGKINLGASLPPWMRSVANFFGLVPDEYKNKLDIDLSDATAAYSRYRENTGQELIINLEKGYNQDESMKKNIDNEIFRTQQAVEALRNESGLDAFNVSGGLHPTTEYPVTENWQKTVGAFNTWSYGEVKYDNGEYTMQITVNSLDRYNFNKGMNDIGTGTPDDVNGRFEALGWAKSFDTKGEMTFDVTWKEGEASSSSPVIQQGR